MLFLLFILFDLVNQDIFVDLSNLFGRTFSGFSPSLFNNIGSSRVKLRQVFSRIVSFSIDIVVNDIPDLLEIDLALKKVSLLILCRRLLFK